MAGAVERQTPGSAPQMGTQRRFFNIVRADTFIRSDPSSKAAFALISR